jgi:hypothetical protein
MGWSVGWRRRLPGRFWVGWRKRIGGSRRQAVGFGCGSFLLLACCAIFCLAVLVPKGGKVTPAPPRESETARPELRATEAVITPTPRPTDRPPTETARPVATATHTQPPAPTPTHPTTLTFTPALPTSTRPPAPTRTTLPVVLATDTPAHAGTGGFDRNGDGKVTCADFSTQAEAQAAYDAGQRQLDGNDRDGKACESLP